MYAVCPTDTGPWVKDRDRADSRCVRDIAPHIEQSVSLIVQECRKYRSAHLDRVIRDAAATA